MYNIIESGHNFVDYQISDVGAEQVNLPIRLFYEDGLTIEHIDGETLLSEDYSLVTLDSNLTNLFGKNVYKQLYILNPTYQTGMLTINFVGVGDTLNATDVADLQTQLDTKLDVLAGGPIEGDITVRDILPNMAGATGDVSTRNIGSATQKFNAVYADEIFVGASSLYVNGKKVIEDVADTMTFKTDEDQGLAIKTLASTPGSGNGNLAFQSDNEVNILGKGGVEITVPVGITSKNLTISNAATNGQVLISSTEEVDITATTIDLNGTVQATNLIVSGDLTVEGATVTLDTQTLLIEDNMIEVNKGQVGIPAESLVSGIEVNRGDSPNYRFIFEELTDSFKVGESGTLQAVATREDAPAAAGVAFWNDSTKRFDTHSNMTYNGTDLLIQARRVVTASAGTVFPGTPGFADECYRTDLDEWYKYNGAIWMHI